MIDVRDACNLGDDELEARRETLRRELAPHARAREALPDGVALRFDATPAIRAALDEFVRFERGCCPGLGFTVRGGDGALRLEIRGVASDAPIFEAVGAPPVESAAPRGERDGGCGC